MHTNRVRLSASFILAVMLLSALTGGAAVAQTPRTGIVGQTLTREGDGAEMVFVPSGEFVMGSADADQSVFYDQKPQHTVYLDAFWIDKYEVTNARYQRCVAAGSCPPSHFAHDDRFNGDRQPVVGISWGDATAYARWVGGRLPTEAEWEKAARGTDGRIYPWGNQWDGSKANTSENGLGTATDVGSYPDGASPYGALDMAGNVWEWVADWHGDYPSERQVNPTGPESGQRRVERGGSSDNERSRARCADRTTSAPDARGAYYDGFRVVASPGSWLSGFW